MKLLHIYKGFAVYHDSENQIYLVDGYDERKDNVQEIHSYIDKLGIVPFLNDQTVRVLYKLGYVRTSFVLEYGDLVKKEKWSNGETELMFHFDNILIDIKGPISALDIMKITQKAVAGGYSKKDDKKVISNIVRGHLKSELDKKGKIKDVNYTSNVIAAGVMSHMIQHY